MVKSNSSAQTRAKRDASGVESEVPHPHIHGEMAYGQSLNSFTSRPEWGYAAVKQGGFYHAETAKYYTWTHKKWVVMNMPPEHDISAFQAGRERTVACTRDCVG